MFKEMVAHKEKQSFHCHLMDLYLIMTYLWMVLFKNVLFDKYETKNTASPTVAFLPSYWQTVIMCVFFFVNNIIVIRAAH